MYAIICNMANRWQYSWVDSKGDAGNVKDRPPREPMHENIAEQLFARVFQRVCAATQGCSPE